MVEGAVQVAVFALSTLAADLVVLPLDMVVAEGARIHVHCIPAWRPILQCITCTSVAVTSFQDVQHPTLVVKAICACHTCCMLVILDRQQTACYSPPVASAAAHICLFRTHVKLGLIT